MGLITILFAISLAGWSSKSRTSKYVIYAALPSGILVAAIVAYIVNYKIIDYVNEDMVVAIPIISDPRKKDFYPPDGKYFEETIPSEAKKKIEGEPTSIGSLITKILYIAAFFILAFVRAYLVSLGILQALRHTLFRKILQRTE